jgi:beta-lactamase regulating signal transducer with metallopeptidase domain
VSALLHAGLGNAAAAVVLAVVAALATRCCRRRPAVAHGLWLLVLLKLLTPPLLRLPLWPAAAPADVPAVEAGASAAPPARADAPPPVEEVADVPAPFDRPEPVVAEGPPLPEPVAEPAPVASPAPPPPPWPGVLAAVWLGGALAWFALAFGRLAAFRRLLRYATPAPPGIQARARRLADALGLRRCPDVRLLPGRLTPMLWAAGGAPLLLLPERLLDRLDDAQLDTLLAHELAHLRRGDHLVRWLELLALGLYWWLPAAWFARRRLREAEEQCCDAWVVACLPGAGRAYAAALVETLDFLAGPAAAAPALASGLGEVDDLKRRLTMILSGKVTRALGWRAGLLMAVAGAAALALSPGWASAQPPPPKVEPPPLPGQPGLRQYEEKPIPRDDLDKLRAELKKLEAELATRKAVAEAALADLRAAEGRLRQVTDLLHKAEGKKPPRAPSETLLGPRDPGDTEKRLADMERRLDALLKEMHELRKSVSPARPLEPGRPPEHRYDKPLPPQPRDPGLPEERREALPGEGVRPKPLTDPSNRLDTTRPPPLLTDPSNRLDTTRPPTPEPRP